MKKLHYSIMFIMFVFFAGLAVGESQTTPQITSEQEVFWTDRLNRRDFAGLLDAIQARDAEPWPRVVSSSYSLSLSSTEKIRQERLRELALQLLEQFDEYRKGLEDLPLDQFTQHISSLLPLRNLLVERPSYVNLLLADSISRVLFIELVKRIVAERSVTPELERSIIRLRRFNLDSLLLVKLIEEERGESVLTNSHTETDADQGKIFYKLMEALSGDLRKAMFPLLEEIGTYRLLYNRDMGKLLYRYWTTDYKIHIVLPLLVEYIRKADNFTAEDSYEKIRRVLKLTSEYRRVFDSKLNKTSATVIYDIVGLLEAVRKGSIELFAAFDLSPQAVRRFRAESLNLILDVSAKTIYLHEPIRARLRLVNRGSGLAHVLSLSGSGIDATSEAKQPLELEIKAPDGRKWEIQELRPYLGLSSGSNGMPISKTFLDQGSVLEFSFYITGDWTPAERKTLFNKMGKYYLSIKYFPLWRVEGNWEIVDESFAIESNKVEIAVLSLSAKNLECWQRIKAVPYWWLLYDPSATSLKFLEDNQITQARGDFAILSEECSKSTFYPYLEYTKLLLKSGGRRAALLRKRLNELDVDTLRKLSKREGFQYQEEVRKLLQEITK